MRTRAYDTSEYLDSDDRIADAVRIAFTGGDETDRRLALCDAIKAHSMNALASQTGIDRNSLYAMLNGDKDLDDKSVAAILYALQCTLEPAILSA